MSSSSSLSSGSSLSQRTTRFIRKLKNVSKLFSRKSKKHTKETAPTPASEVRDLHAGQAIGWSQWPQTHPRAYGGDGSWVQMSQTLPPDPSNYLTHQPGNSAAGAYYHNEPESFASFNHSGRTDNSSYTLTQVTSAVTHQSADAGFVHRSYTCGKAQMGGNEVNWTQNGGVSIAPGNNVNLG
ncbi:hypothetical protein P691DRAFT_812728 [Macrolepiota fuliginosa MF-IS2]|uniref:Uncharacterized protein n=1 Tax=Macrolepiota fuliginosa MF-IS2 TaxID=1400762 RepID=A0A9P5XE09_9AGAR|nr:hypothetical protein P691DRAFT_812728 [Macrolepiota fuliginosa MF-IS2]